MSSQPPPQRKGPKLPLDHDPTAVTEAREAARLTKTALAGRIGKSLSLISEIEGGTRNATPEVLERMASVLGCSVATLQRKAAKQESA